MCVREGAALIGGSDNEGGKNEIGEISQKRVEHEYKTIASGQQTETGKGTDRRDSVPKGTEGSKSIRLTKNLGHRSSDLRSAPLAHRDTAPSK